MPTCGSSTRASTLPYVPNRQNYPDSKLAIHLFGLELVHARGQLFDAGVLFVALVFEEEHLVDDLGEGALGFFEFGSHCWN